MTSEDLSKKIPEIKRELKSNPPKIWIKFSVFKSQIKSPIPTDAETTPKKVYLYLNATTGEIFYSNNKEPFVTDLSWSNWYSAAQVSTKYDAIILSNWDVGFINDLTSKTFTGTEPFNAKKKMSLNFFLIVNKNKDAIGNLTTWDYKKRKFVESGTIKIGKFSDFFYEGYYRWLLQEECLGLTKAFQDIFKIGLVGGNTYTCFNTVDQISSFLNYKEPVVRTTPKQKLVDKLLEVKLKTPKMTFNKNNNKFICVASKVNEEYSALRWFIETPDKKPYEVSRLYINKTSQVFCRKNTKGEYVVLNNKLTASSFDSQKVMIQDKNAFDGTKLEYFTSIYKELKPSQRGSALYMLTVYPEFERMYKSTLKHVCINYLEQIYQRSWPNYLKDIFGTYLPKEKNLNKMFGFNKHQLELINSANLPAKGWYRGGIGATLKSVLNVEDCSNIDKSYFDPIFELLNDQNDYHLNNALRETIQTYSLKVCVNMIPTLKKMNGVCKPVEITTPYGYTYHTTQSALMLYTDYVRTVRLLGTANRMRPHFDTFEDIHRMHDDASVVYNMKKNAIESEKFVKRSEFWKKWEYDEDEKFVVIAPKLPEDLATEGITLHHCVKSYIQRVSDGATNIMFIRQKSDVETPFFTVEVGNKGSIEQVHGFGNRNANTEPGLENFVKKWAKERKLNATNYNKVR